MQGRTVAEICEQLDLKPHVLRYWEEQIPWLSPERSMSGHRMYTESHVHLLFRLKYLIEQRGFTLQGAAEQLVRENTGEAVNLKSRLHPLRHQLLELRQRIENSRLTPEPRPVPGGQGIAAGSAAAAGAAVLHPVESYLPGISRIPLPAQLQLLQDYTAFLPDFRLPLLRFLYPEQGEPPAASYTLQRPLHNLSAGIGSSADNEASGVEPGLSGLLIIAAVYSSPATAGDVRRLFEAVVQGAQAVLLTVPGDESQWELLQPPQAIASRVLIQAMPVFPDITPDNRLLLSPGRRISRYFPGPGIALQSVLGDPDLHTRLPQGPGRRVWYRPLGLAGLSFCVAAARAVFVAGA